MEYTKISFCMFFFSSFARLFASYATLKSQANDEVGNLSDFLHKQIYQISQAFYLTHIFGYIRMISGTRVHGAGGFYFTLQPVDGVFSSSSFYFAHTFISCLQLFMLLTIKILLLHCGVTLGIRSLIFLVV